MLASRLGCSWRLVQLVQPVQWPKRRLVLGDDHLYWACLCCRCLITTQNRFGSSPALRVTFATKLGKDASQAPSAPPPPAGAVGKTQGAPARPRLLSQPHVTATQAVLTISTVPTTQTYAAVCSMLTSLQQYQWTLSDAAVVIKLTSLTPRSKHMSVLTLLDGDVPAGAGLAGSPWGMQMRACLQGHGWAPWAPPPCSGRPRDPLSSTGALAGPCRCNITAINTAGSSPSLVVWFRTQALPPGTPSPPGPPPLPPPRRPTLVSVAVTSSNATIVLSLVPNAETYNALCGPMSTVKQYSWAFTSSTIIVTLLSLAPKTQYQ